jgi:hypothetical protein
VRLLVRGVYLEEGKEMGIRIILTFCRLSGFGTAALGQLVETHSIAWRYGCGESASRSVLVLEGGWTDGNT